MGMNPSTMAMMQGISQGSQEAQSILPNQYQPQGKAMPQNPYQGTFDTIIDQLIGLAKSIRDQGVEGTRDLAEKVSKCSHELTKVNNALTDLAQKGNEANG